MTKIVLATLTAIAISAPLLATSASADEVDRRQYLQSQRIEQARRAGELNWREYRSLKSEQHRIADLERRFKSDGHLSYGERQRLRGAQNEAGRHIYQESHDGQKSWFSKWN